MLDTYHEEFIVVEDNSKPKNAKPDSPKDKNEAQPNLKIVFVT